MLVLLMVQKSGDHQFEVGSSSDYFTGVFLHPRWLFGISEPSTVSLDRCDPSPVVHSWVRMTSNSLSLHRCEGGLLSHLKNHEIKPFLST